MIMKLRITTLRNNLFSALIRAFKDGANVQQSIKS